MLKTGLSRPAGLLSRVAIRSGSLRIASPTTPHLAIPTRINATTRLVSRICGAQARLYSAGGNAGISSEQTQAPPEDVSEEAPGVITRFGELSKLGVDRRIVESITMGMNYDSMTEVQSKTLNPALSGKDIVAQAKTGTGKTLAFLVPIVHKILSANPNLSNRTARSDDIQAIIISPTRELAEQISVEAKKLCRGTGIVVQLAVGGTQKSTMLRETRARGCHLLVATPGRLNDLLQDHRSGIDAPNLSALVLDEADRMLDVGFEKELENVLQNLPSRRERPRQTLLYSATIPANVVQLARRYVDPANFEFVQTVGRDETPTHEKVPQYVVPCNSIANLHPTLYELITREAAKSKESLDNPPFKAIVFLPTTSGVEFTAELFRHLRAANRNFPPILNIHSKLSQAQRTRASQAFRTVESGILFSSDVTARGLDFPNVSHVIQVGCPNDRDQYIHRIGRTGRADKSGEGWLLIPNLQLGDARHRLAGLPLNKHTDLACATTEVEGGIPSDAPEQWAAVSAASESVGSELCGSAYSSYLGGAMKGVDTQALVDDLNMWSKVSWGMAKPPPVAPNLARNVRARGLNVEQPRYSRRDNDRDFGRDNRRDSGRDYGRSRSGYDNNDPWAKIEYEQRERGGDRRARGRDRDNSYRSSSF